LRRKATKSNSRRRTYLSEPHTEFLRKKLAYPHSPRELQVLIALGNGQKTLEICAALNITAKTVNAYLQRLEKKLEVANFNQLIRAAALLVEGIVPSEPNESNSRSFRICSECQKLFSVKRADEGIPELAGYRILDAVLKRKRAVKEIIN
jgi:DNA-binding CsgD family transcriptional regulator